MATPPELPYGMTQHRHNFSVWAAARAAQRGFSGVAPLRNALEACGVVEFLNSADLNDIDAPRFDALHRQWCAAVVAHLNAAKIANVTFGRAAKLIAVYLKSAVVLGRACETAFAAVAHPPIDSILLVNISNSVVTSGHKEAWAKIRWTKLDEERYYELIAQLRQALGAKEPFWKLERFWTVTYDSGL